MSPCLHTDIVIPMAYIHASVNLAKADHLHNYCPFTVYQPLSNSILTHSTKKCTQFGPEPFPKLISPTDSREFPHAQVKQ